MNSSGGEIGTRGWQLLENTVQLRPGFVEKISCEHRGLQEAVKEDMMTIWRTVGDVEMV